MPGRLVSFEGDAVGGFFEEAVGATVGGGDFTHGHPAASDRILDAIALGDVRRAIQLHLFLNAHAGRIPEGRLTHTRC